MLTVERVKEEAMLLSDSDRAHLATDLLQSLPVGFDDEEIDLDEIKRRDAEMDTDPSMVMTWDQLKAALGR